MLSNRSVALVAFFIPIVTFLLVLPLTDTVEDGVSDGSKDKRALFIIGMNMVVLFGFFGIGFLLNYLEGNRHRTISRIPRSIIGRIPRTAIAAMTAMVGFAGALSTVVRPDPYEDSVVMPALGLLVLFGAGMIAWSAMRDPPAERDRITIHPEAG